MEQTRKEELRWKWNNEFLYRKEITPDFAFDFFFKIIESRDAELEERGKLIKSLLDDSKAMQEDAEAVAFIANRNHEENEGLKSELSSLKEQLKGYEEVIRKVKRLSEYNLDHDKLLYQFKDIGIIVSKIKLPNPQSK